MSVSAAIQSASFDSSIPDQISPKLTYEYVDGGFHYTVAYSTRGREFISLPGLTATQVQELFENGKVFPPENLDGGESFGLTHGWHIDRYTVGIVAEDGVLWCTVYDEAGTIIYDEGIPQTDSNDNPIPAGEIYCRYLRSTPFVNPDGKPTILCFGRPTDGDDALSTWEWKDKILSLVKDDEQFMWQLFDRATGTTSRLAFANTMLENPDKYFFKERIYNDLPYKPSEGCPVFLLEQERVNVGQLMECASDDSKEELIRRITKLIQNHLLKIVTSDNQLKGVIFEPLMPIISTQSQLDPTIPVDASRWAVTLVNTTATSTGHAALLIEKVNKRGHYQMRIAHLTFRGGTSGTIAGIHPGRVKYEKVVGESYPYHSKTETWSLPRDRVKPMLEEIKKEKSWRTSNPVVFAGRGNGTIFMPASSQTPVGSRRVENCLNWAVNKLLSCGAKLYHLPEGVLMNRPAEFISSYERSRERAIEVHYNRFGNNLFQEIFCTGRDRRIEILPRPLQGRRCLKHRLDDLTFRRYPMRLRMFIAYHHAMLRIRVMFL